MPEGSAVIVVDRVGQQTSVAVHEPCPPQPSVHLVAAIADVSERVKPEQHLTDLGKDVPGVGSGLRFKASESSAASSDREIAELLARERGRPAADRMAGRGQTNGSRYRGRPAADRMPGR